MKSLAVNGFTAAQVNAAIRASALGMGEFRFRFELLDAENNFIRELGDLTQPWQRHRKVGGVLGGSVHHVAGATIKRAATLSIREGFITLDDYPDLVVDDGPLFFWKLNETSGAVANDSSGNARHGTAFGVTWAFASLLATLPESTSGEFNGATSNVEIANAAWMNVSNITLEAWISTTHAGFDQEILNRDGGSNGWQFRLETDGRLAFHFWTGAAYASFVSSVAVNDGVPHHVAVTYDGAHVIVYIDSIRVLRTAQTAALPTPALAILAGLNPASGQEFAGPMQMLAMWGRALSALEIREHWQQGSGDLTEIDYERDRIKIYCAVKMESNGTDGTPWAETAVALFLLSSPDRDQSKTGINRTVECFDQTVILDEDSIISDRYVLNPQNYITAVTAVLQSAGLDTTGYQLTPTTLSLPVQRAWPVGTTKLQIVNDLLKAINYRPFRFSGEGLGIAEPNVLPEDKAVEFDYSTGSDSITAPDMTLSLDLAAVPNRVILARLHPKLGNIYGIATNNNFNSPVSVKRRGDRVKTLNNGAITVDAADQTTINAMAVQMLSDVSQPSQTWRFKSALNPFHEDQDKLTVGDTTGKYSFDLEGEWIEDRWTLPLDELGLMEHEVRRVIAVS